jgi:hypothetical protein
MNIRARQWNDLLERVAILETQVASLTEHASNGGEEPVAYTGGIIDTTSLNTTVIDRPPTSEVVIGVLAKQGWGDLDQATIDVLEEAGHVPDSVFYSSDEELLAISGIGPARLAKIRKALS